MIASFLVACVALVGAVVQRVHIEPPTGCQVCEMIADIGHTVRFFNCFFLNKLEFFELSIIQIQQFILYILL